VASIFVLEGRSWFVTTRLQGITEVSHHTSRDRRVRSAAVELDGARTNCVTRSVQLLERVVRAPRSATTVLSWTSKPVGVSVLRDGVARTSGGSVYRITEIPNRYPIFLNTATDTDVGILNTENTEIPTSEYVKYRTFGSVFTFWSCALRYVRKRLT